MLLHLLHTLMRSRGHGVHSPSAFDFITNVACQPLPFYGYDTLAAECRGVALAQAKLALRVVNRLQPASVAITGGISHIATAVKLASSAAVITPDLRSDSAMLIAAASEADALASAIARGVPAIALATRSSLSSECIDALQAALPSGHIIYDRRIAAILLPRTGLEPQAFEIRIPR